MIITHGHRIGDAHLRLHRDAEIIRELLAGRALGPIGMDELATEQSDIERDLVAREVARLEAARLDPSDTTDILQV